MTAKNGARPLGWRKKISYGFGGMGNAIVLAMVSTFLMFYYTDVIGLSAAVIGTLMLVSKMFDGASDLVMGRIVDRTKSRFGKARCYLLWLSVPYAITGVLLFLLHLTWPDTAKYVWVLVTYNLVTTVFFTGVCVLYNAMNALLTKDQYDRGVLGITNVMGDVAAQFTSLGHPVVLLNYRTSKDEVSPYFPIPLEDVAAARPWMAGPRRRMTSGRDSQRQTEKQESPLAGHVPAGYGSAIREIGFPKRKGAQIPWNSPSTGIPCFCGRRQSPAARTAH